MPETIDTETALISSGELARRLSRSLSGVKKLEREGRIPPSIVILGSGRKVWPLRDLPAIEDALKNSRRRIRAA